MRLLSSLQLSLLKLNNYCFSYFYHSNIDEKNAEGIITTESFYSAKSTSIAENLSHNIIYASSPVS